MTATEDEVLRRGTVALAAQWGAVVGPQTDSGLAAGVIAAVEPMIAARTWREAQRMVDEEHPDGAGSLIALRLGARADALTEGVTT